MTLFCVPTPLIHSKEAVVMKLPYIDGACMPVFRPVVHVAGCVAIP